MSDARTVVTRGRQIGIVVVIAALFVVPPIVRATSPIGPSSLIRLNRGFETPPAKADPTSLAQIAVLCSIRVHDAPLAARRSPHLVETIVAGQADRAPALERGPPASHI